MKSSLRSNLLTALAFALVFAYVVYAVPFSEIDFSILSRGYFFILADNMLAGHLYLESPENTYDLSLFDHHWYLYWGPAPSLVIAVLRPIFLWLLNEHIFSLVLGLGSVLVWYRILGRLKEKGWVKYTDYERFLLVSFLGLGTLLYHATVQASVWFQAHVFVFFFFSLALGFALNSKKARNVWLSGICFAASILTRQSMVLLAPFLFLIVLIDLSRKPRDRKQQARSVLSFLGLMCAAFFSVFFYNKLRFGAWLQFGHDYQAQYAQYAERMARYGRISFAYLKTNVRVYLLDPVQLGLFPLRIHYNTAGNALWSYQHTVIIPCLVFIQSITVWARSKHRFNFKKKMKQLLDKPRSLLLIICAMGWISYFAFLLSLYSTGEKTFGGRYLVDILPLEFMIFVLTLDQLRSLPRVYRLGFVTMLTSILVHQLVHWNLIEWSLHIY